MEQFYIFSVTSLLLSLQVGATAYFLFWIIGRPNGVVGNPNESTVDHTNILSFFGKWVIRRFNEFEEKENNRLNLIYTELFKKELVDFEIAKADAKSDNSEADALKIIKHLEVRLEATSKALSRKVNREKRRLNPYKSIGACFMCFSTWISSIILSVLFFSSDLPLTFATIFFLTVTVPTSVVVSKIVARLT